MQAAASTGTHSTYWHRMANVWGDWRLDEIAASNIEALHRTCNTTAVVWRNWTGSGLAQLDRLLTEMDHPYGDRSGPGPHQPGNVLPVEYAIAKLHDLELGDVRRTIWRNVNSLARETDYNPLLGRRIRSYLIVGGESLA